jgi:hypothetical protein
MTQSMTSTNKKINQGHENTSRKTQPKAKKTLAKERDQSNEKY